MLKSSDAAAAAPGLADVEAAAKRISGHAQRTPLLRYPELDRLLGTRAFIKPECLQVTGSFKFRGAYNKIKSALDGGAKVPGVVAFSSGNHAQGVAAAAATPCAWLPEEKATTPGTLPLPSSADLILL